MIRHGTGNGYVTHKCRCERCTAYNREYMRQYRGSVTATLVPTSAGARLRAAERLIAVHPDEFRRFLDDEVAREVTA